HACYGRPGHADGAALAACAAGRAGLARISPERIGAELRKLLAAPDPAEALALMQAAGVLAQILPGTDAAAMAALIAAEAAADAPPDWRRRLAALRGAVPVPVPVPALAAALRLSRAEAAHLRRLDDALSLGPAAAAFHHGP